MFLRYSLNINTKYALLVHECVSSACVCARQRMIYLNSEAIQKYKPVELAKQSNRSLDYTPNI